MDEQTVRGMLEEIRKALAQNEEEHETLASLFKGLEGWLRMHGITNGSVPEGQAPLLKDGISLRQAVLRVLKEARGEPLHVKEILRRVRAMGADTNSKNPEGTIDLVCYSWRKYEPLTKVSGRTWRWGTEPDSKDGA